MRRALFIVVVGVLVIMQVSLVPAMRPLGVVPNVMLPLVIMIGLRATVSQALAVALVGGLAMDLSSGTDFGIHTGILVLAALVTGSVRRAGLSLGGPLLPVLLVAGLTVLAGIVSLGGLISAGGLSELTTGLGYVVRELVINLMVTLGVTPIVHGLVPDESSLPSIG